MVASLHSFVDERAVARDLQRVNPLRVDDWDDLLLQRQDATIFHSRAWAQVLAETYGYTPEYFVASESQVLFALLPLFEVRSWITGVRGVSLPFTDQCEALDCAEVSWSQMFSAAQKLGRDRQWRYLELRGAPESVEPSSRFYIHDLDLSVSDQVLFNNCDSAMRRAIRKAEKEGIRVEATSAAAGMETYYFLHRLTRQKHGIPPQPLNFFRNIFKFIIQKGYGSVLLAYQGQQPVAGAVYFRFGASSIYKFGASDPEKQSARPNNLLLWEGALKMKQLGARVLSFGRTSLSQEGLRRFKLSYGASESIASYTRYSFLTNQFTQAQPERSTGVHTSLFRFCPRPLSRLAGAAIYPHIG